MCTKNAGSGPHSGPDPCLGRTVHLPQVVAPDPGPQKQALCGTEVQGTAGGTLRVLVRRRSRCTLGLRVRRRLPGASRKP